MNHPLQHSWQPGRFTWRRSEEPFIDENGDLDQGMALGGSYCPTDYPNLPNVFAKVRDERTALRFARTFGLLGHPDESRSGDPIRWVLLQASTVRFAGELIESLSHEGVDTAANVLARWALDRGEVAVPQRDGEDHTQERVAFYRFIVAKGADPEVTVLNPNVHVPRFQATDIVGELVTANTAGVRWRLYGWDEGSFFENVVPSSLIEAIWWHVGQWALSGRVRLCENPSCRAPFRVMDERQRYCPGDHSFIDDTGRHRSARSMCAAMHQQAETRKRKREG